MWVDLEKINWLKGNESERNLESGLAFVSPFVFSGIPVVSRDKGSYQSSSAGLSRYSRDSAEMFP
jgi:hypothetical protein